jgi:hypothetical protein
MKDSFNYDNMEKLSKTDYVIRLINSESNRASLLPDLNSGLISVILYYNNGLLSKLNSLRMQFACSSGAFNDLPLNSTKLLGDLKERYVSETGLSWNGSVHEEFFLFNPIECVGVGDKSYIQFRVPILVPDAVVYEIIPRQLNKLLQGYCIISPPWHVVLVRMIGSLEKISSFELETDKCTGPSCLIKKSDSACALYFESVRISPGRNL